MGNNKSPIAYTKTQTVFHHDDIPENKRIRKNEVNAWIKSKILSLHVSVEQWKILSMIDLNRTNTTFVQKL